MKIIHIAHIKNDPCSGVDVVVPEHVTAQGRFAGTALLNITNEKIPGVRRQYAYKKGFSFDDFSPNLAVFHEVYRIEYLSLAKALRQKGIPYIIVPHGELNAEAQMKKHLKKSTANLLLFNRFINGAEALQMLSKRELESTDFGKRKFIGTNGINIPEKRKKSFNQSPALIYIGRLDAYHKGLDLMLDAIALVRGEMREAGSRLDIYGPDRNGEGEIILNMIKRRKISDLVRLHPAISGEKKAKALLSADLFIQTSRFEGMPMGVLEALSYGLPCVLSEGTTLSQTVEKSGAGFACRNDAKSIALAIKKAMSSASEYEKLSKNATDLIRRDFSWDTVAVETIEKYKDILGEKI